MSVHDKKVNLIRKKVRREKVNLFSIYSILFPFSFYMPSNYIQSPGTSIEMKRERDNNKIKNGLDETHQMGPMAKHLRNATLEIYYFVFSA